MARIELSPACVGGNSGTAALIYDDVTGNLLAVKTTGTAVATVRKAGATGITTTSTGEVSLVSLGITRGTFDLFDGQVIEDFIDIQFEVRG